MRTAALLALLAAGCAPSSTPPPLRVAAAADLSQAFAEVASAFRAAGGRDVVFTFGSTGLLAHQVAQGAPFDVFAAADHGAVEEVVRRGVCDGTSARAYARGRLAVWSRRDGPAPPGALTDLADVRFARIAIAQPEHAPYGRAALAALRQAGVVDVVRPRLVFAENVRQALQLATSGNADAAIVALPLVAADRENPWWPVDEALHPPLLQTLVVCGDRDVAGARAFADFVVSGAGRAILTRHGFGALEPQP